MGWEDRLNEALEGLGRWVVRRKEWPRWRELRGAGEQARVLGPKGWTGEFGFGVAVSFTV